MLSSLSRNHGSTAKKIRLNSSKTNKPSPHKIEKNQKRGDEYIIKLVTQDKSAKGLQSIVNEDRNPHIISFLANE
jgi:hypothetical protein